MKTKKYKHLSFEDRCVIEEFLNNKYNFTQIGHRLHKDRTTISDEVRKHRYLRTTANCNNQPCCFDNKPPYVCNGCPKFNSCHKIRFSYSHDVAYNEYVKSLSKSRSHLKITKEQIASINDIIAPLMVHKHHTILHHRKQTLPERDVKTHHKFKPSTIKQSCNGIKNIHINVCALIYWRL